MAKRRKIYLDTSIISAYFDTQKPLRLFQTVEWVNSDAAKFDLFISPLVVQELSATRDEELRAKFLGLVARMEPIELEINDSIKNTAQMYRDKIIPKEINDSIHIALASHHHMDAIVSWNFSRIVNLETISAIHKINQRLKLPIIEILSLNQLGGNYVDV